MNLGKSNTAARIVPSGAYQSLALAHLAERFKHSHDLRVLDLGAARPGNIAFYTRFATILHIEDLHSEVVRSMHESKRNPIEGCLELGERMKFDLIVSWDLFNYLPPKRVNELGERLQFLSHADTILFACIWTTPDMPATPLRMTMCGDNRIEYAATAPGMTPAPRYNKRQLGDALPWFDLNRSFLIRNGIEEYLMSSSPIDAP